MAVCPFMNYCDDINIAIEIVESNIAIRFETRFEIKSVF